MKPKYTAGPWKVEIHDDHTSVEAPMFTVCADVTNDDAYLIAAAPELLAFVQAEAARDCQCDNTHKQNKTVCLACYAAKLVAKAEGKEI